MKKIVLFVLIIFFITGCDVNYELYYKSPNKIEEKIQVDIINNNALLYSDSVENYATDIFNGWRNSYDLKNYKYKLYLGSETSTIVVNKTHNSLNEVIDNNGFKTFFDEIKLYSEGNDDILELSGYKYAVINDDEEMFIEVNNKEDSNLYITIKSNYDVDCNADEQNSNTGVYKWTFTPNDKNKTVKIKFLDQFNFSAYLYNLRGVIFTVVGIILFALIVYFLIIHMKKRNININKI